MEIVELVDAISFYEEGGKSLRPTNTFIMRFSVRMFI